MSPQRACSLFAIFVAILLPIAVQGTCPSTYFAEPIRYEDAVEIDFYYTGINLKTVTSCATFCSQREFCRSAVYNRRTRTCGISYDHTVSCSSRSTRYEVYDENSTTSDLIRIACVDKCNPAKAVARDESKTGVFPKREDILKPIGIITGNPHDGRPKSRSNTSDTKKVDIITEESLGSSRAAERPRAEGYVTRLILSNITGLADGETAIVEPIALPSTDAETDKESKKKQSQICFRTFKNRYLLGASFENHDVSSVNECRCLCAATYRENGFHKCRSFQYRAGNCVLNKGNHLGRFDLIDQRKSLYQYVDCDSDVLLEVANGVCKNFKSMAMMATTTRATVETDQPTSILSTEPTSAKTTPESKSTTERTTTTTSKATEATTFSTETSEKTTTSPIQVSKVPEITTETTPAKESTKTLSETSEASSTTIPPTKTADKIDKTATAEESREKKKDKGQSEAERKNVPEKLSKNQSPVEKKDEEPIEIQNYGCFEVIDDHLMVSVAGGLEHDVSLEECQCHCANSKKSGKYPFQCASATYYHIERDCILNLEDRFMRSNLFEKQFVNFNVSYVGITCSLENAQKSTSRIAETGCRQPASESSMLLKKKKMGEDSDTCFVELTDFVLEGTAVAVETGISSQECKCKCAEGQKHYGEECQSFLYYYDSNTCLMNKQNRFSNPEKFNFVPSANQRRSYFEWTCASKEEDRKNYLETACLSVREEIINGNTLNADEKSLKYEKSIEKEDSSSASSSTEVKKEHSTPVPSTIAPYDPETSVKKEETSSKKPIDEKKSEESPKKEENVKPDRNVGVKPMDLKVLEEAIKTQEKRKEDRKMTPEPNETKKSEKAGKNQITQEKGDETKPTDQISSEISGKNQETAKLGDIVGVKPLDPRILEKAEPKMKREEDIEQVPVKPLSPEKLEHLEALKPATPVEKPTELPSLPSLEIQTPSPAELEKYTKVKAVEGPINFETKKSKSKNAEPKRKVSKSNPAIPEAEGFMEDELEETITNTLSAELDEETSTLPSPTTFETIPSSKTQQSSPPREQGVKTHKFDDKIDKNSESLLQKLTTTSTPKPVPKTTTIATTTTTTIGYPPAGRCTYSALYQTSFVGRRLLKTVQVKTPADCFAACFALRCRSANLSAQGGGFNSCELFRDSLIDYRRPDMIGFEASTVYFDGINCDGQ